MPIDYRLLGKANGDFRMYPGTPKEDDWWRNTERSLFGGSYPDVHAAYRARCGRMTRNIVEVKKGDKSWMKSGHNWIFVTEDYADGIVSWSTGEALMIANADCPVLMIWDLETGLLAFLHCALQTLVPPDGSDGIVMTFFKKYWLTETMHASLAFGINRCCYGFAKSVPPCTANSLVTAWPIGTAIGIDPANERYGKPSIDLFALMEAQLLTLGMKPDMIISNAKSTLRCTSCKRDCGGNYTHWSNARDGKETGRNLAFAIRIPDIREKYC